MTKFDQPKFSVGAIPSRKYQDNYERIYGKDCEDCDGKGKCLEAEGEPECETCKGKGKIKCDDE